MIRNALIAVYILVVLAISAIARAENFDSSDLQNYNYKSYVGEIVTLADGSVVLTTADQQQLVLQSQIELTPFIGNTVMIDGIELEHQPTSANELKAVDPLPGFGSGSNAVIFFVFNISEVSK